MAPQHLWPAALSWGAPPLRPPGGLHVRASNLWPAALSWGAPPPRSPGRLHVRASNLWPAALSWAAPPPRPPGRLQCRGIKNQQIQTNQQIHEETLTCGVGMSQSSRFMILIIPRGLDVLLPIRDPQKSRTIGIRTRFFGLDELSSHGGTEIAVANGLRTLIPYHE